MDEEVKSKKYGKSVNGWVGTHLAKLIMMLFEVKVSYTFDREENKFEFVIPKEAFEGELYSKLKTHLENNCPIIFKTY